jgi:hypothetical protein
MTRTLVRAFSSHTMLRLMCAISPEQSNRANFNFDDFTWDHYEKLLRLATGNYTIAGYQELSYRDDFLLWRHDVDYSPQRAVTMAKLDAKHGVRANFFVLIRSDFYNFLDEESINAFAEIRDLGHHIGLHFDASFQSPVASREGMEARLAREREMVMNELGTSVDVFSFHNPTPELLQAFSGPSYAGMVNAYSRGFFEQIGYCSDSNGYWRFQRLEDVLTNREHRKLQVLTHPEWWTKTVTSPHERAFSCIDGRANWLKSKYTGFLEQNDRKDIDW